MNLKRWLIFTLTIGVTISASIYIGSTLSSFSDEQTSSQNIAGIRWGLSSVNDGFEDFPWDVNWSENGATDWIRSADLFHSGQYSAFSDDANFGYLTSNDIDASTAENLNISFWYYGSYALDTGECLIETYNGTAWNTWYDITLSPGYAPGQWNLFSQSISDPAYYFAGLRIRFNTTALSNAHSEIYIDDFNIVTDTTPPATPTGLTPAAGDAVVYLNWTSNNETDLYGYNIYRSLSSGGTYTKINSSAVTINSYTDSGLTNSTPYFYKITAVDYGNNESDLTGYVSATPEEAAPSVPTGLTATPGEFKVTLDWNDNTDYDLAGYNIYRSISDNTSYSKINGSLITSSEYSDTGLTVDIPHYYMVSAVDTKTNESANSTEVYATPTDNPPAAPTNLTATAGDMFVTLNWEDNTEDDLAGYDVYRSTTSGSAYTKINISGLAVSAYTDEAVSANTTYYYIVKAYDGSSQSSANSNEASAVPYNSPPAAPTALAGTGENTQASLDWNDNTEDDLAGYSVYRSETSGGPYTKITQIIINSEYVDTGLTNGVQYFYVVTASDNISQESSYSAETSATPGDPPPDIPTGLTATAGDKQITLDWNNNIDGDLKGYNVYRSLVDGGPYTKINTGNVTTSAFINTDLTGNTTYYYVVTAVDLGLNESGYSLQASATVYDANPAAPTNLLRSIGAHTVYLDWDNNTENDLQGYNVYRSLTENGTYTIVNTGLVTTNSYTDSGLTNSVAYFYQVTAVDLGANEGSFSNKVRAVPFAVPITLFDDGFEATPWYSYWNDNDTTSWTVDTGNVYSGTNSALTDKSNLGYLTTDDINTASADNVTISFWFYGGWKLAAGECLVEYYNGTTYVTQYDIMSYSEYTPGQWVKVTQFVTNPNYLISNFRLRFNTTGLSTVQAFANVDQVQVIQDTYTDTVSPTAPAGLNSTAGDTEVYLTWTYNPEPDIWGYNVYRSTTNGGPYTKINSSLIDYEYYTDTSLSNGTTYYYVITAVDYANNESSYSVQTTVQPTDLPPAAPTGLTALAGDRQVTLDWDNNSEPDLVGYSVYRSMSSGTGYTKITGSLVATSNYTDTDPTLNAGTTYYYVVTATDSTSEGSYSNEASAAPYDNPPTAPTGLTATAGDRQVTLDWDNNSESDFNYFNVLRSTTNGTGYVKINTSNITSSNYTDTANLTPAVPYYYVVRAVDDGLNMSPASAQASATPIDGAPGIPAGLTANASIERQVLLDWDDNSELDLEGYNIYRSTTSGSGHTKINTTVQTTSNYTDEGLTGGTTYYYYVRAVDESSNESGNSTEVSALVFDDPPAIPTGLTATKGSLNVHLQWNANNSEDDFNSYSIYRSITNNTSYIKTASNITDTEYYDFGLTAGTTYYYMITSVDDAANESGYSNEVSAVPDPGAPPAAPTGLIATAGDRQVSLDWNDNTENLTGYNLYRSITSNVSGFSKINGTYIVSSNYIDTGLTGSTTYYYIVTAVNTDLVESANSTPANATPWDTPPAAPANPSATAGDRQMSINWDNNSEGDFDHYDIFRSETSGSGHVKINASDIFTNSYTDTGLTGGVTYYYILKAYDAAGNPSANSTEVFDQVYDNPPAAPTSPTATAGVRQISLDWDDNNSEDDFNHYDIYRSLSSGSGYTKLNTSNITVSAYVDTALAGGTTYYYIVNSVDDAGNPSANATEVFATVISAPPTGLAAASGDQQITLNWDANLVDSLHHYNVYRSTTSGSGYSQVNTTNSTSTTYIDTGLTNGVPYYYVVTTVDNAYGESAYSTEDSAIPIGLPPATVTGLTATKGVSQVSLDWDDNSEGDLAGYNVYRSTTSGGPYSNTANVTSSNYLDSTVNNGVIYYYVIKAKNNAGQLSDNYSAQASARPYGPPTVLLNEGFETGLGSWNDNGTTAWTVSTTQKYSGTSSIYTGRNNTGPLTTDDLSTLPGENLTISFWFMGTKIAAGDVVVNLYNGSSYVQIQDLSAYAGYSSGSWVQYNVTFTYAGNPEYFINNFRLQLVSNIGSANKSFFMDDVVITINP